MQIYNTFTRKKEEFKPLNPPAVSIYMCGPTVYNYFHIGNARSFIMADILRRYLEYRKFDVNFIMNLTDVDDNIIRKSVEEKKSASEVSEFYTRAFFEDIKKLKIKPANAYPKATMHIQEMIDVISDLEKKEIAYEVDGNVFYDISKFPDYGKLSGKKIDDLESGARVEINEEKRNPLDFSLWKKAKEGEPSWDSPWGNGRPGWHIECTAMSTKLLGKSIDIHAGGNDLIFPHHENEIAQSEACFDQKFVKYWIHFGFLNIQNEKMSKSLGNFFTARDVLQKYSAETIRLFFAQTNYGGPLNFSDELLSSASKGCEKISNLVELTENGIRKNSSAGIMPDFDFEKYRNEFIHVMDDDFNTPKAVAVIFDLIHSLNKIIAENENINVSFFHNVKNIITELASEILGIIDLSEQEKESSAALENELIELLITIRDKLKKEKQFALSDQIRDSLSKLGVTLKDTKSGVTFKKN
ncbi:MAG: cysteine--tRNA ligase [Ignavibacteriae bacterium HGW-Ignavibacteriae-3]|nr:MAG: cysteine--tRNA ligase [Ignavibacteriae bacterium HGW-Ignavibacteriae-3]